jgi:hypothetical protein
MDNEGKLFVTFFGGVRVQKRAIPLLPSEASAEVGLAL